MLAAVDSDFAAMILVCIATRATMMVAAAMVPMHVCTVVVATALTAADVDAAVAPAAAKVFASAYAPATVFALAHVLSVCMLVAARLLAVAGYVPDYCHSNVARASVVACRAPAIGAADATHPCR